MYENEEVWAHCANKGGTKAGQFCPVDGLGGAHCISK